MARRILVAEDSPTQAALIRLLLEGAGYQVDLAANGREGLERVQVEPPDLIISDVMMPEMDGYAFCQAVKSAERTRRIPFVLLTQRNTPEDILQGLTRGADNFIPKPFDDEYLLERIKRIFEHLEFRRKGQLEVDVTLRVGDRELVINPDKQQIVELLFATFEDVCKLNQMLLDAERKLEDYTLHLEAKVQERTEALRRLNRDLRAISLCNQALVRAANEEELPREICRTIVEVGEYRAAWVGFVEEKGGGGVRPAAVAGCEPERVDRHAMDLTDPAWATCPVAMAIRTGMMQVVQNIPGNPPRCPWHEEAVRLGIGSSVSLPLKRDGRPFGALTIYSALLDAFDAEEVTLLVELANDLAYGIQAIRTRVAHERALAEIESMARFPKENPNPVMRVREDGVILYANAPSGPLLRLWESAVGDRMPAEWSRRIQHGLETRAQESIDLSCDDRVYSIIMAPVPEGGYVNLYGRDITERKRAEEALHLFKNLVEHSSDAVGMSTPDGRHYYQNEAFNRLFGDVGDCPPESLYVDQAIGKQVFDMIMGGESWLGEVEMFKKDRTILNIFLRAYALHNQDSRIIGLVGLHTDITERKRAEGAVRESEARYRTLFEDAQDGMALADAETGRLVDCNHALCRMVERDKAELVGQAQSILHPPETDTDKLTQTFRQHQVGDPGQALEDFLLSKSGKLAPVEIRAGRIRMNGRDYLLGIFRDITERKRAEEVRAGLQAQLIQSQKLEAIGTLAGGVAHEINNPITGIMNYAQLIADKVEPKSQAAEYAGEIIHETERVATIVRNLLQFSRQEKQSHSLARIEDIIEQTLSLLRAVFRRDQITLAVDVPEGLPGLKCRSQQIQQVLMNLLTNARDALNEKYPGYHEDKRIQVSCQPFEKEGRPWLRVTVADHGPGIPAEIQERIFEPFFTTKPRDQGTGLGLSISHGIVKDHHGALYFETQPGAGTQFHLGLPADNGWTVEGEKEQKAEGSGQEAGERGSARRET